MISNWRTITASLGALVLLSAARSATAQSIKVVSLIPFKQSAEEAHNSEPTLAVNPQDANQIAATAHLWGADFCPFAPGLSAIMISRDGGDTWRLRCVVAQGSEPNSDPSMRFSAGGDWLYLTYLKRSSTLDAMNVLRKKSTVLESTDPMTLVKSAVPNLDQPQLRAWEKIGSDGVVIGATDNPAAACDGAIVIGQIPNLTAGPNWPRHCVSLRPNIGAPFSPRVALHANGTGYVAYLSHDHLPEYCWVDWFESQTCRQGSVIVAKSAGGAGPLPPPNVLTEAADPLALLCDRGGATGPGVRVASCRNFPIDGEANEEFGFERRTGSALSIVVDPNDASRVVVAWGDSIDGSRQTLHVRQSRDGGANWSSDLFTVRNATNPTLAFDVSGRLGFSYQRLVLTELGRFWETHFLFTDNDFDSIQDFKLAVAPAYPADERVPYMGDYMDLIAVGDTFYGVFSTIDDPRVTDFPFGVTRARRVVGNELQPPTGSGTVIPSMDPFFFRIRIP